MDSTASRWRPTLPAMTGQSGRGQEEAQRDVGSRPRAAAEGGRGNAESVKPHERPRQREEMGIRLWGEGRERQQPG